MKIKSNKIRNGKNPWRIRSKIYQERKNIREEKTNFWNSLFIW